MTPRTEAGQALEAMFAEVVPSGVEMLRAILAIEQEAVAAERERLRKAIRIAAFADPSDAWEDGYNEAIAAVIKYLDESAP